MMSRLIKRACVLAAVTVLCGSPVAVSYDVRADDLKQVVDAGPFEVATLTPQNTLNDSIKMPGVLSGEDIELYIQVFALQKEGQWKKANALIAKIQDVILMGHVLEQRYMHPNKYRSKYKELKDWMETYADHPQAARIYKLALRRRPSNWKYPQKPDLPTRSPYASTSFEPLPGKKISKSKRYRVRQLRRQIKRFAGRGQTLAAKRLVKNAEVKKLFSNAQYDEVKAMLGFRYFIDGRDEWALEWAGSAADRSGDLVPEAHWAAGLAAYRLGKVGIAANHFEAMTTSPRQSPWLHAAGAFWAARAHMQNRAPQRVSAMLQIAAEHSRTFYGMLAAQVLGLDKELEWAALPIQQASILSLADTPRGRRAIALIEIGQQRRAEKELRLEAAASESDEHSHGILALAANADMPELAVRLDAMLFPDGGFDSATYPLPSWEPDGGFTVDSALVFAFIRQESRFNPKAKSWAGARGLMQLMPRTASFVARDRSLHSSKREELFKPGLNMALGQRYIEILRDDNKIKGNLVSMIAAWNGGPGNLNKWRRNTEFQNDPLLFIEAIPSRETRQFVEHVLSNLWIYRDRMGQETPSLRMLASGQWPVYTSLEHHSSEVAENDR
jgi:soluble lytic murein transglycosylase